MENIDRLRNGGEAVAVGDLAKHIIARLYWPEAVEAELLEAIERERSGENRQRYAEAGCDDGPRDHG
jgi:hypothetical protein